MIKTGRTRSFTAVKGLSRHILARRAAVFHGPLDGCALLRGVVVPITGNSADREYFRDREASVRRRAAARRGWRRERRWGAAPHPGLFGELFLRVLPELFYKHTIHKLEFLIFVSMFFGAAYRAKKRRHKFKKRSFVDSSGEKPRSHNRLGYLCGTNTEK